MILVSQIHQDLKSHFSFFKKDQGLNLKEKPHSQQAGKEWRKMCVREIALCIAIFPFFFFNKKKNHLPKHHNSKN